MLRTPIATLLMTLGVASAQELELASPFADDMILQRQLPVPVWGWAKPGSAVTVAFAGQSKQATSDTKGQWRLSLDALTASSAAREFVVSSGAQRITRTGVLVGEVWFASGQSNMEWVAGKSMCRELANRLQRSKVDEPVREFQVDTGSSLFVRSRAACKDGWKRSRHAGGFSALALAFAWTLHQELKVPVGILRASHGATNVETWTPYEGFAMHPELEGIAKQIRQADPSTPVGAASYEQFYRDLRAWQQASAALIERGGRPLPRPLLPGIAQQWKGASRMYNKKVAPLIPFAIRGVIWCQGTHNAGDGRIYATKMQALVDGLRKNWGRPQLPFYFTQMQCYGNPDPDSVGFGDIREAQRRFFMNSEHVGMVVQHDLNPQRPQGIHHFNKLDPGKRLARWALARQYGKDLAYTGPIYKSHRIDGATVRVQFEQRGPGGGLMVGSKGLEKDYREPGAYVEPARETKGVKLAHFRVAGEDGVWHAAEAVIQGDEGDEVVVSSAKVEKPVGVQYAYSGSPVGANLYNRAGLPATPFAYFRGKQLFQEDLTPKITNARAKAGRKPYVQVATLFRPRAVIQRDQPVTVWGFARPGAEVTVRFAGQTKQRKTSEFEQWRVTLDALPAAAAGRTLTIRTSDGAEASVPDIVVGDVYVLTGSTQVSGELIRGTAPAALPLVREFRIRTKARRFREPRKRCMEIGGGKYRSHWRAMTFPDGHDTSVFGYHFAKQVQQPGVPVGMITLGADNPPITWISYAGLQTAKGFEKERDELNLLFPNTASGKAAVTNYIATLRGYTKALVAARQAGQELPDALAESPPDFPQPKTNQWARYVENATLTYNFCIAPLTPLAARAVVWVPGKHNIGADVARYAPALEALAKSLPGTFGAREVPFLFAQPAPSLVTGIGKPSIVGDKRVEFTAWPKSLKDLAVQLGGLAKD